MQKTIYVADKDLALFDRAEELGGESLSAVIADALRRYVATKEAEAQGYEEHIIEVGHQGREGSPEDTRKVKLVARLLTEQETHRWNHNRGTDIKVYQTRSGKIVVWWEYWTKWQDERDVADYVIMDELPGYDQEIVGQAYDLELGCLPGNLIQEAAEAIGKEAIEVIE
mgnify:CR=1 FL=1